MEAKSKILLTSLMSIAFASSLIAGSTYALFTSKSEVNIAVTSDRVYVVEKIDEESLKTYSMQEEQADGSFENGGYAGFDNESKLILENMAPGDLAEFDIKVINYSTVNGKVQN